MSATRFLCNDALWSELQTRVGRAKSVKAAVAFFGTGGADLLPLKKGDTLVVNLGMQTVKQGLTAPKEIQRLQRRGVRVFTRSTLHAKFFICDRTLLVGSANVSRNSQRVLDEAASSTDDLAAIRRAADFFEDLCTEPVRPEYLKLCIDAYKPPKFDPLERSYKVNRNARVVTAKLWFIGGIHFGEVPEREKNSAEEIERHAAKHLRKADGTSVDFLHYPEKPRFLPNIRVGDWIVVCISDSEKSRFVYPPSQVLGQESYSRGRGKRRYLLLSEKPNRGQEMPLAEFRRRMRRVAPELDTRSPRTKPIESVETADTILRFWTGGGRIAK